MDDYQARFGNLKATQAVGRILRAMACKYTAGLHQHADRYGAPTQHYEEDIKMIARLLGSDGVHDLTTAVPELWDSIMALSARTGEDVSWLGNIMNTTPLQHNPSKIPEQQRGVYLKFLDFYKRNPNATIEELDEMMR